MIKLVASVVTVVVAVFTLHAKTVAWYHFDEGEIGTEAKGDVILNSVDPDSLKATGFTKWGGPPPIYPIYTNAFPEGVTCYDPVSGKFADTEKSLWFHSEKRFVDWAGARSIVGINDADPILLKTFTVECFLKYAEDLVNVTTNANPWFALFTKFIGLQPDWNKNPELTYQVFITGRNDIRLTIKTVTTKNEIVTTNNYESSYKATGLLNGRWHHVAVSFDDSIKKAKLFYDYNLMGEIEYEGDLIYPEEKLGNLQIGSTYDNFTAWNGRVDEFRISDEALTVDKFLSYGGVFLNTDDKDIVCYMNFSDPQDFGVATTTPVVNRVLDSYVDVSLDSHGNRGSYQMLSDVSAESLRQNINTPIALENLGSLYMQPPARGDYGHSVWVDDLQENGTGYTHPAFTNSWTIEMICKVPPFAEKNLDGGNRGGTYLFTLLPNYGVGDIMASIGHRKDLAVALMPVNGSNKIQVGNVSDFCNDQWHHLALTYDRPSLTASLYVDYVLKGRISIDYATGTESGNNGSGNALCLGNGWAPWHTTTNYFDEFRLTTRALTVQEFLTSNPYVEVPYAAYIDFDGDCSVQPYETVTPAGVVEGGAVLTTAIGSSWFAKEEGGQDLDRRNTHALQLIGAESKVLFERNIMLENLEDQTIEFFVKGEEGSNGNNIVNLTRSLTDGTAASRFWGISLSENSIAVYADTAEGANQGGKLGNVNVVDGKWHHVAVTFAKKGDAQTEITVWIDYVRQSTATIEGTLKADDSTTSALTFGGDGFKGAIDEFKVSPTIVPDTKFMRFYYAGTMIIVR